MGNTQVLKTTTNRSVYNKARLFEEDVWSRYERNRLRREYYYRLVYPKKEAYCYHLIQNIEFKRHYTNEPDDVKVENYGVVWEWRYRYKCTVVKQRKPSWKLTSKCKRQYQSKKMKDVNDYEVTSRNGYNFYTEYKW